MTYRERFELLTQRMQDAERGDLKARDWLLKEYSLKVFTPDEITALNYYREKKRRIRRMEEKDAPIVNVRDKELVIMLPTLRGIIPAQLNWLQSLGEGYYEAGLTLLDGPPRDQGHQTWVLKRDAAVGFKPLFCSMYWEDKE